MKLAVFSDIHGNLMALEAVLADLDSVGEVDQVWCLGDIAAFGPRPAECVKRVREMQGALGKEKMHVIGGNTDRYLVTGERFKVKPKKDADAFAGFAEELKARDAILNWNVAQLTWEDYEYLKGILGKETSLHAEGYGWVVGYHAIPGDDEAMLRPDTPEEEAADALLDRQGRLGIGGHIHVFMDREVTGWRLINVGSVGMSFDMPNKAQWGLFTFENGEVTVDLRSVEVDTDALIADLNDSGHPAPEWITRRLKADS